MPRESISIHVRLCPDDPDEKMVLEYLQRNKEDKTYGKILAELLKKHYSGESSGATEIRVSKEEIEQIARAVTDCIRQEGLIAVRKPVNDLDENDDNGAYDKDVSDDVLNFSYP